MSAASSPSLVVIYIQLTATAKERFTRSGFIFIRLSCSVPIQVNLKDKDAAFRVATADAAV